MRPRASSCRSIAQARLIDKHALKKQPLIVHCSSAHCNAAELLAEKLRSLGCKKVQIYPGGWEEWVSGREGDGVK